MTDTLEAGKHLEVDQPLISPGGHVRLVFQSDGNLVLYCRRPGGWLARWASNTEKTNADRCALEKNGSLTVGTTDGKVLWSSSEGTARSVAERPTGRLIPPPQPPILKVKSEESVVIKNGSTDQMWSSGTSLEGTAIKSKKQSEIYELSHGKRHLIPDPETLTSAFGGLGAVNVLTQPQIEQWSVGNPVASARVDISNVRICLDRESVGPSLPPRQHQPLPPRIAADGTVLYTAQQPLAGETDKMWNIGQVLRVKLLGGTPIVRTKVRQYAEEWMNHANIQFQFVDPAESAHIRIAFDPGGSWSYIGRDALWFPFDFATMNFGWFDDATPDHEFSRTTLHEFGHALGFVHEHQSPAAGIQWDREKAYAYFMQTQGWDRAAVEANVFDRYSVTRTNYSVFDPASIMEYPIPASITLDGKGAPGNNSLSDTDKEYARRWYPASPTPKNSGGMLRTGDDCDEIDFSVEYGVVEGGDVVFALSPGPGITWWKAIEIPSNVTYTMLEIEGGITEAVQVPASTLDASRPLRFWKAKGFGQHARLGYTWDVVPALPGGSRVSLVWKRDRC